MSVVSVGSINVDRVHYVDPGEVDRLAARHGWFPGAGETVEVTSVPDEVGAPDETFLGGKGANQAVAAAAAGAETTMCGRVGRDAEDLRVRERLREKGVDVGAVEAVDRPTGTAHVWVTPDGENRIAVVAGANDAVDAGFVDRYRERVAAADVVLLQNEIPVPAMVTLLDGLPDPGPTVVLDPAPSGGAAPLYGHGVDVTTPNEAEYEALAGALAASTATVVRTEGAAGATVLGDDGFHVESPAVDPVDATGAGDTFAGYLAAGLAAGDDLSEAVERAVVAGALSTESAGAQSPPAPAEVAARR